MKRAPRKRRVKAVDAFELKMLTSLSWIKSILKDWVDDGIEHKKFYLGQERLLVILLDSYRRFKAAKGKK